MTISVDLLNELSGGPDLAKWFNGHIPSFHDAEVVEVSLQRIRSRCAVKIHVFEITPDIDKQGYYVSQKHTVVSFLFDDVSELELTDFNHQNVIDGLSLTRLPDGHLLLEMEPCYGLFGKIKAASLQISLEPGVPPNSAYSR